MKYLVIGLVSIAGYAYFFDQMGEFVSCLLFLLIGIFVGTFVPDRVPWVRRLSGKPKADQYKERDKDVRSTKARRQSKLYRTRKQG